MRVMVTQTLHQGARAKSCKESNCAKVPQQMAYDDGVRGRLKGCAP